MTRHQPAMEAQSLTRASRPRGDGESRMIAIWDGSLESVEISWRMSSLDDDERKKESIALYVRERSERVRL